MKVYVVLSECEMDDFDWHIHDIEAIFESEDSALDFVRQKNKELVEEGEDSWNYFVEIWTVGK